MADKTPELTVEEIDALEPFCLGPTWKTTDEGGWFLPPKTLGWQVAGWCAKWLRADDGSPWKYTREQLRFLLWWFAVDDSGRFIYRKGVLQRMKGWGKDPLLATLCLVELVGPSRFGGWDRDGQPIGIPHPRAWVQVTAVNQAQTTNTMELMPSLMSDEFIAHYGINAGAEIIRAEGGRKRLVAVTSSYRSLEGGRTTFTLLNETHHWVAGNGGHKMYETIDGNATKTDSRYLAITNAYLPGEDSVAEKMRGSYEKIAEGRMADIGFLYDTLEAHPKTPLTPEALRIVLPKIRGDAVWLRPETIMQSILDGDMSPSRSRRMWLNQIVAEEDALYGPAEFEAIYDPDAVLVPGDEIVLGFDGGKTDDATALVAIRVKDACAFVIDVWEKPDGSQGVGWIVPRDQVDSKVHETFSEYTVLGFYADVALWESYISEWDNVYGEGLAVKAPGRDRIGWDMRASQKTVTLAHERLVNAILNRKISYDGDPTLRRHALNARRRTTNWGVSFGKESKDSPKKVDAYAALMLAHEALHDYRTKGKKQKQRTGRSYWT